MKKLIKICLCSAGIAALAMNSHAEQKIATFNLHKAFDSYYKTIQSTAAMKQDGEEVAKEHQAMMDNLRKHNDERLKLVDKANDQAVSAEERQKSKRELDDKIAEMETEKQYLAEFEQRANVRLREKEQQRVTDIVKEIQGVVAAHAKAAGYSMVVDSSANSIVSTPIFLYTSGQDDMTDSIIKELNAAAPPGSLNTNAAAGFMTNSLPFTPPIK